MSKVIEHRKFVFVNAEGNNNKSWEIKLFDNDDVEVLFGRIGKGLQSKLHSGAGRKKMESLIRDKTKPSDHYNGGCYRELEVLDVGANIPSKSPVTAAKSELKEIAKKQIATCAVTQKLIEFFTEVNAHDIHRATGGKITYDISAGTFRTPLGIVTRASVDKARDILDDITDLVSSRNFNKSFVRNLEDYLMLIPQDVGRKFEPQSFCGDVAAIQRQSQILDGLEASISAVLSSSKDSSGKVASVEEPKLFNVKLNIVKDNKITDGIVKYFNEGRQSIHVSSRMKLQNAYAIDMVSMRERYTNDGAKMTNQQELWHGTKPSNILSILKGGFIIPPSTASHVCGRMFSNGVYFANSSTKSLNYATSYWGGKDEGRYFMFLCKVALGKYQVPSGPCSSPPSKGYDSYWAKKGLSGVVNDEIIVFRTSQIQPLYLTEWK